MLIITRRPNPTIREMKIAAHQFCSFHWEALKEDFDSNKHAYTRTFQLPQRCVEALYMVTLLERGFGLDEDYKGVTIALEVQVLSMTSYFRYLMCTP